MPKLPAISSKEFIKYLSKLGFQYIHTRGSHHIFKKDNKMISVPEREVIGKGLLNDLLEEAGINKQDFIREWNR